MPQYEYLDENDNPIPEDVALSGAFNVVDDQPELIPQISSSEPDTGFLSGFKRAIQSNLEDPLTAFLPGHMPSYEDTLNEDLTYNPDQPRKPQTMADILHTAVNAGGDDITSAISGLTSRVEDNINPLIGTNSQIGEALRQQTLPYRQDRNATLEDLNPTSGLGIGSNLIRSGVAMSPALLPGMGLIKSAGVMGLQSGGNKYTQMRDMGVSPEDAGAASNVSMAGTGLTSLLPLGVLKKEAGPLLKTIESAAAGAGFGEMNVPIDTYANYLGTGEAPTYDEMVSQIPRSAGMGALLGSVLGAAHGIAGKVGKGRDSSGVDLNQFVEDGAPGETQLQLPAPEAQLGLPAPPGMEGGQQALPAPDSIIGDNFTARQPTSEEAYISRAMSSPQIPDASLTIDSQVPILKGQPEAPSEGVLPEFPPPKTNQGIEVQTTSARSPEEQIVAQQAQQSIAEAQKPPLFGPNGEPLTQAAAPEGSQIVAPFTQKGEVRKALSPEEATIAKAVAKPKPPIDLTKLEGEQSFVDVKKEIQKQEVQRQVAPGGTAKSRAQAAEQVKMNLAPELEGASQSTLASRLKGERGAVTTEPLRAAVEKAGDVVQGVKDFVRGSDPEVTRPNDTQQYFEGGRVKYLSPLAAKALGKFRKSAYSLVSQMDKDPRIAQAVEGGRRANEARSRVGFESGEILQPYFRLPSASSAKVDAFIVKTGEAAHALAKQGKRLATITDDALIKGGWKPNEIEGYRSFRQYTDYALDKFREAQIDKADSVLHPNQLQEFVGELDQYVEGLRDMHYFPRSRFGTRASITAVDPAGRPYREHFETLSSARKAKQRLNSEGYKNVDARETPVNDFNAYQDVAPSSLSDATIIDPERFKQMKDAGLPVVGWGKHLLKSYDVPGYSKDIRRNISDYAMGLANYYSKNKIGIVERDVTRQLTPEDQHLSAKLKDYFDFLKKPSEASTASRILNLVNIAAVPIHVAVNQTATGMFVFPEAIRTFGSPYNPVNWAKATDMTMRGFAQGLDYILPTKKLGLTTTGGELGKYLKEFERSGLLDPKYTQEMIGYARGPGKHEPLDAQLSLPMKIGEQWQRASAAITAYHAGKAQGLKGDRLMEYARDFFYRTVPDHSKVDRPPFARDSLMGKSFMMYKNYIGHWVRLMKSYSTPEMAPLLLASLGPAIALGGVFAPPGAKETKKILASYGLSPEVEIRKAFSPETADRIIYGLGSKYLNIGGAVSTQEFLPEIDKDPVKAVVSAIGGPYLDYFGTRPVKALKYLSQGEVKSAANTMLPRFGRNISKAAEMLNTGKLTDAGGFESVPNATTWDAISTILGAPPLQQSKSYEAKNQAYDEVQRGARITKHINDRFNEALQNNDTVEAGKIILEARKLGIEPRRRSSPQTGVFDKAMKGATRAAKPGLRDLKGLYEE